MGLPQKIDSTEKRRHERHKCQAVIKWTYFNQDVYFDAKLINFSNDGVYFETGRELELKPGVSIFLDMKRISSSMIESKCHQRPKSVSLGEVRWCADLSRRDQNIYGIGVRFLFAY
jgi:hypothetical protein